MGFTWVAEHEGMRFPMRGAGGPEDVTVMIDRDADDYVCGRCQRDQHHRCTERECSCCSGVPSD